METNLSSATCNESSREDFLKLKLGESDNSPILMKDDLPAWLNFSQSVKNEDHLHLFSSEILIEGMHCSACAINIENILCSLTGIISAEVNAVSYRAKVVWDQSLTQPLIWFSAIEKLGYQVFGAQDWMDVRIRNQKSRQALWRLLVAGFCMMQVMMYSVPLYTSNPIDMSTDVVLLLRWASWILSLPVILFSCTEFWKNAWRDLLQRQISMDLPVALGLIITFAVSTVATFSINGIFSQAIYFDSLTMFVFFLLLSRWMELKLRNKTAGALEELTRRLPDFIERLTPLGDFEKVYRDRLEVNDIIRTHPGESFAGDGEIFEGQTWVEQALLTGESFPTERKIGQSVFAGSYNLSSTVLVKVHRIGAQTRFAEIVQLMEEASLCKPEIVRLVDRIAKPFLWGVIGLAIGVAFYGWSTDPSRALMMAVSVLIVTCPCALSLAAPVALLAAAGNLARQGIFIRDLNALEKMTKVNCVVFDKTGTLTQDSHELREILTSESTISMKQGLALNSEGKKIIHLAWALSSQSFHPLSLSVTEALSPYCLNNSLIANSPLNQAKEDDASLDEHRIDNGARIKEWPGKGVEGWVSENTQQLPRLCRLGSLSFCEALSGEGSIRKEARGCQVHLVEEAGWLGSFALVESIRPDATQSVVKLRAMNLRLELLSGDLLPSVERVSRLLGFDIEHYAAQCSPEDKLNRVAQLQKTHHRVATVGDGFNDMPALARSDVSFVFGRSLPYAKSKADVVVMSNKLFAIPQSMALAKRTMRVVKQNFFWAATYNAVCIPLAVSGFLAPWASGLGMALSSILVICNSSRMAAASALLNFPVDSK